MENSNGDTRESTEQGTQVTVDAVASTKPTLIIARQKRSDVLNIRMQPALRERIEKDAERQKMRASALARKILAQHYEKKR